MIGERGGLRFVQPGQRPSAGQHNMIVRMLQAEGRAATVYEDSTGTYVWPLVRSRVGTRQFELKDALTPGGSATAYRRNWNDTSEEWEADTDDEFEVYDELGIYRGRAKDAYSSPHDEGSIGWAQKQKSGRWEITHLTPAALMIRGQNTAAVATTDSTFTIDGVAVAHPIGGIITDQNPAGNITIYNVHDMEGDNNGEVTAIWNEATDHWEGVQMDCPA